MSFRKYNHVVRLDNVEVEGLLDGDVTVSYKIDGTNSCCWYDPDDDSVHAGSRTRELSRIDDNGGFYTWLLFDTEGGEQGFLRGFLKSHPDYIVYGEWLGYTKFLGSIKDYDKSALGHLWIFDIYDRSSFQYLPEDVWRNELDEAYGGEYPYKIPYVEVKDPTMEKLMDVARGNDFLLKSAGHPGEGIVIRRQGYQNQWGHYEIGKIVLDEFKQHKSKKQKVPMRRTGIEADIVDELVSDSEISKAIAKVEVVTGVDFNKSDKGHVGRCFNEVWCGAVLDEMKTVCKKWKFPTVDFAVLKKCTDEKVRNYLFGNPVV